MSVPAARVTVGIPTFNRAKWLAGSVESVLAQSFTDFRILISDNASEDDTPAVVAGFDDARIDYVRSEHNIGPVGNFNRLIDLADTEFLVLLPDDDTLYPGYLEAAVSFLTRHESAGLVHTGFDALDANGSVIHRGHWTAKMAEGHQYRIAPRQTEALERRDHALERLMVSTWPLCFSSIMYRTRAIVDAGGMPEGGESFGDLQLWMRIALNWDFGYIATRLTGFRIHQESVTTQIGTNEGVMSVGRELRLLHAQMRFDRRKSFIDTAPLEPATKRWLTALADAELLSEQGDAGPSWGIALLRVARIAASCPRIVLTQVFWRVVLRVSSLRTILLGVRDRVRTIAPDRGQADAGTQE